MLTLITGPLLNIESTVLGLLTGLSIRLRLDFPFPSSFLEALSFFSILINQSSLGSTTFKFFSIILVAHSLFQFCFLETL